MWRWAHAIACFFCYVILITTLALLWSQVSAQKPFFGWGDDGNQQIQVPLQSASARSQPQVMLDGALSSLDIEMFEVGEYHGLALSTNGTLWAWGQNAKGQWGTGSTSTSAPLGLARVDTAALAGKTIKQLAVGTEYSMVLTTDGQIYTWGSNENYAIGSGDINPAANRLKPEALNLTNFAAPKPTFTSISAGAFHACAISTQGDAYCWGSNQYKQIANESIPYYPMPIDDPLDLDGDKAIQVAAGERNTLVLTAYSNEIIAFGDNTYGQFGSGTKGAGATTTTTTSTGRTNMDPFEGKVIKQIGIGLFHAGALTDTGEVYMWGQRSYGAIGDGNASETDVAVNPTLLPTEGTVLEGETVVALRVFRLHSLVVTSSGLIASWGSNAYGQIGDGNTTSPRAIPSALKTDNVLKGVNITAVGGTVYSPVVMGFCLSNYTGANCQYLVCPAGQAANENQDACEACPSDMYSPGGGAAKCSYCPTGYVPNEAQSDCERPFDCDDDEYYETSSNGTIACQACPPGTYPDSTQSTCLGDVESSSNSDNQQAESSSSAHDGGSGIGSSQSNATTLIIAIVVPVGAVIILLILLIVTVTIVVIVTTRRAKAREQKRKKEAERSALNTNATWVMAVDL